MNLPMSPTQLISVVVDESVRESLESLLKSLGFRVSTFAAAEEFRDRGGAAKAECLVLDVRLDGMISPPMNGRILKLLHKTNS